jgi:3-hydroxybutyryl-CoA dehydrogenase
MHTFEKVAVVGEGKMGSSLFMYLSDFDFHLTWLCSSSEGKVGAAGIFEKKTRRLLRSGILTGDGYNDKLRKTCITSSLYDLSDCDLVIEAITEDAESKRNLFKQLDNTVNSGCIFASNSSSILPSLLIPSESRKDKMAGLHFFFPVALKSTVEIISSPFASGDTTESLKAFILQIQKKPFLQYESHAFVLNRILLGLQACAFHILREGRLSMAEIDEIVKSSIFPAGVFEFFDHVGIDIMLPSVKSYTFGSADRVYYVPMIESLQELVDKNQLGIKSGKGFYDYSSGKSLKDNGIQYENEGFTALQRNAEELLWDHYMKSVSSFLDAGVCSREALEEYLRDYLGIDRNPFSKA